MRSNRFIALVCLALVFSGCDSPSYTSSGSDSPGTDTPKTPAPTPEPPKVVSTEEALAILRLDKDPVRDVEELTVVVEDFLSDTANISGTVSVPVITDVAAYTITAQSGFAIKSPDSEVETLPESSDMPFYRYTLADTATGAAGLLIASGDKRIGGVIAYIEDEADDPAFDPFMDILADRLTAYVDGAIDAYNSISPADAQTVTKSLSQKASQNSAYLRSVSPGGKPDKGTDFLPLLETKWNQDYGYWDMVNNPHKTPDSVSLA
jgi:hypothetical protein